MVDDFDGDFLIKRWVEGLACGAVEFLPFGFFDFGTEGTGEALVGLVGSAEVGGRTKKLCPS